MSHRAKDDLNVILPDDEPQRMPVVQTVGPKGLDSKGRPVGVHTQDCGAEGPKG